ncbi:long-chain-fatty-acid--ligase [Lynx pardinus]|uniref:long-chain-fatty-acid--CoA ligase n=1 Tax=Lynx pardinus TaxID=191816 RepID=A0A485P874_LYNPA|nr:long-chain-fatty-acid--ligase [Lynx pardinus]
MPEMLLLRSAGSVLRTVFLSRLPPGGPGCVRKLSLNLQYQQEVRPSVTNSCPSDGQALSKESLGRALPLSSLEKARGAQLDRSEEPLWTTRADGRVHLRVHTTCPQPPYTVHQMFHESLDKYRDLRALGFKRQGVWEHISYSQYYLLARRTAKGFLKLGLERAHSVAILGFNSPEWFFSAVGTVFAGGIVTGIYTTSSPEACQYIAHDCRANIIVVDTQKQLEKILKVWGTTPHHTHTHTYNKTGQRVPTHSPGRAAEAQS